MQVPEEDWRQALRAHQEQAGTILSLRKNLRVGEALRARVSSRTGGTPRPHCAGHVRGPGSAGQAHTPCHPGGGEQQHKPVSPQCQEEKEVLGLQVQALRKDSQMYQQRMDTILQQMEEVAGERDQVGAAPGRGF